MVRYFIAPFGGRYRGFLGLSLGTKSPYVEDMHKLTCLQWLFIGQHTEDRQRGFNQLLGQAQVCFPPLVSYVLDRQVSVRWEELVSWEQIPLLLVSPLPPAWSSLVTQPNTEVIPQQPPVSLTALPGFLLHDSVPFMLSPWSGLGLHSCAVSEMGLGPLHAGSYTPGWEEAYSRSSEMRGCRYHLMIPCMATLIASFASAGTLIEFLMAWNIKRLPHAHPHPPLSVTDIKGPWLTQTF